MCLLQRYNKLEILQNKNQRIAWIFFLFRVSLHHETLHRHRQVTHKHPQGLRLPGYSLGEHACMGNRLDRDRGVFPRVRAKNQGKCRFGKGDSAFLPSSHRPGLPSPLSGRIPSANATNNDYPFSLQLLGESFYGILFYE